MLHQLIDFPLNLVKDRLVTWLLTVWNGLPLNIRLSPTLDTFKRRLKTLQIAHQHPYHAAHLVTASASNSVPLLTLRALMRV